MQLAIGTTFDYQVPIIQQFAEIAQTEFHSVSLGANLDHSGYLGDSGRRQLLQLSRQSNICLDSLHVPFSNGYDLACVEGERRMGAVCRVAMCMAAAKELGIGTVILHLNSFPTDEYRQDRDSVIQALGGLIESAEIMDIKIAAENIWGKEPIEFLQAALSEYQSEHFGFCYDSSHDQLGPGRPYELLEQHASRLFALHLSDNDGQDDRHWLPFTGIVDWKRITDVLRQSNYHNSLLLEVENSNKQETTSFLHEAAAAALQLREMIIR